MLGVPSAPPLVIPKTRTVNIGGEQLTRERLTVEIAQQGVADVQWLLRTIALADTGEQVRLGNPPNATFVDNRASKNIADAQRKVVVFFGTRFATAAMRIVENELRRYINAATTARTGRLQDVGTNWRWRLVVPGQGSRVVTSASDLPTFTRGTMLVLEPIGVPYATIVNMRVRGGKVFASRKTKRRRAQAMGFLGATVNAVRARPEFRQFAISVVFTRTYPVPGEISHKQGTGVIVIKLKGR